MQATTRYARNGQATLAWTELGSGPVDLLFSPGFISHVEHFFEDPALARFLERLASFSRVILMDRRGTGLSDPIPENFGLEGELTPPEFPPGSTHVFHQYVIRAARRDLLRAHLKERGVASEVYYPIPLHLQPCFASLGYERGDFPEAERAAGEVLALPIYPELAPDAQTHVVAAIRSFYR